MIRNDISCVVSIFRSLIVSTITSSKYILVILLYLGLVAASFGQQFEKDAQTGFQFISVTSDARAAAMGEAMNTLEGNSSSLFFNPAGMARMSTVVDASFSMNQWIADIQHNSVGIAYRPMQGKYGVFGLSLISVDYGTLQGTMAWPNALGYIDTEEFSPTAFSMGVGYAKALSDKFAIGFHVKSASSMLGKSAILTEDSTFATVKNVAEAIAFDFGTLFKTGMESLTLGMSVKNFSQEVTYANGVENFQLPLTFVLGLSMDVLDFIDYAKNQSLYVAVDATHPRSHPEQIKVGVDYKPFQALSLRTGYILNNDEDDISFGLGLNLKGFTFDYAVTPYGHLNNVQRLTLRLAL